MAWSFVGSIYLIFSLGLSSAQTLILTSSVEEDGRQAACPGEVVTFTCVVTNDIRLRWIAEPFISQSDPIEYAPSATVGTIILDMSGQYRANITSVTQNGGVADLTSELTVTISASVSEALNGTVVQCSGQRSTTMSKTILTAAPPSPPLPPSYSVSLYHLTNFTVAVQWESPASDGGLGIDNYTLTGAGITDSLTVLSNMPLMTTLTLSYNEMHMVSITASNCAGESNTSVVTIHEVGCGPPPPPPRGTLGDFTGSELGAMVTFQCNVGLVPSQQMMSVCTNGIWTPDPAGLVCKADCGDPSLPMNGFVMAHDSTLEGSQIVFQCNPGLVPSQQMISVCAANGTWTPDPANLTCMTPPPGDCGVPASPTNGTVNYTTTTEGSRATFRCSVGLVPGEAMTAMCQNLGGDDRWNPNPENLNCMSRSSDQAESFNPAVVIAVVVVVVAVAVGVVTVIIICICWRKRRGSGDFAVKAAAPETAPDSTYDYARVTTGVRLEMDSLPKNGFYDQPDTKKPLSEKLDNAMYDDPDSKKPPQPKGLVYADLGLAPPHIPTPVPPAVQYSQIVAQSAPIDIVNPADKLLNLDTALAQLKEVQESWYELGTGLGVPVTMLDEIKSQCPSSQDCLTETVDSWMRGHTGTPTWRIITAVLRQINFQSLAVSIDQVYVTGELPTPFDNRVPSSSLGNPSISSGNFGTPEGPPPPIPARMNSLEEAVPPKPPRYKGGQESRTPPLPSRLEPEPAVPPRPPKSSKSAPPRPTRRSWRRNSGRGDAPPRPPKPAPHRGGQ